MARAHVTRLPKYITTHTQRNAMGFFGNPYLDPTRFQVFWEDFNGPFIGPAGTTSGVTGGWVEVGQGTGANIGLSPTIASCVSMTTGAAGGPDVSMIQPYSGTASGAGCFQTGALDNTKQIMLACRLRYSSLAALIQIGVMANSAALDSTPAGFGLYSAASSAMTFVAGDGTTNAVAGTFAATQVAVDTLTTFVVWYNGAGEVWGFQDNVQYFRTTGVTPATWDTGAKNITIGLQSTAAAALTLSVDYLMVALER